MDKTKLALNTTYGLICIEANSTKQNNKQNNKKRNIFLPI